MPTNNPPSKRVKKTAVPLAPIEQEIVKAVVEDAMMGIAADVAAIAATDAIPVTEVLIAETPEEEAIFDIARVPYLGPSRLTALAAAGITTIDELNDAPVETIAAIKGVGLKQAVYIKNWVGEQLKSRGGQIEPNETRITPLPSDDGNSYFVIEIPDDMPPPPPVFDDLAPSASEDLHSNDSTPLDLETSVANETAQDDMEAIALMIGRLKEGLPKKLREKSLKRQITKIDAVISAVPEERDHLSTYGKKKTARTLDQIVKLLSEATAADLHSKKKQSDLSEELRELRKRLEKALDD
ncbi:MAG: helix-hairpin-helix domain-containing protein [Capsulimonas sp.]|uniref:helix-hairpin-helix domain-containing protein n=1 Tax=Capsulimonas sp. TaxID=2494211 RepID=UPI0032661CC5